MISALGALVPARRPLGQNRCGPRPRSRLPRCARRSPRRISPAYPRPKVFFVPSHYFSYEVLTMDNSYDILLSQSSKRSKQMTRNEAKALWISSFAAFAKLNRNIAKAQFADMQRRGAQFSDFEGLLGRLRAKAEEANKAAIAASTEISIITEAEAEWRKAA